MSMNQAGEQRVSTLLQNLQQLLEDVLPEGQRFIIMFPGLRESVQKASDQLSNILGILRSEDAIFSSSDDRLLSIVDAADTAIKNFLQKRRSRPQSAAKQLLFNRRLPSYKSIFPSWSEVQLSWKMKRIAKRLSELLPEDYETILCDNEERPSVHRHKCQDNDDDDDDDDDQVVVDDEEETNKYKDVFIGHGDAEEKLVARLINNTEERSLRVISLVSKEPVGKTALARRVFNRLDIRRHFRYCRAWIHVPPKDHDYVYKDLLVTIIKQLPRVEVLKDVELMEEDKLSTLLFQNLMELRFLIVLDNVCEVDIWLKIVLSLADAANGSRVILTTRDSGVANQVDPWSRDLILNLNPLSDDESWKLLGCQSMINVSSCRKEILRVSRGLPPAILLLGGLLSNVVESSEVNKLLDDCKHTGSLEKIVDLSYDNLIPIELKSCFLYLALFPKAYEIPTRKLLQLWVAEGFVTATDRVAEGFVTATDKAKQYLELLVRRGMVEIGRQKSDGTPKTCRMPCFLYDFCLTKAEDSKVFHVYHCNSDCVSTAAVDGEDSFINESNSIKRLSDPHCFFGVNYSAAGTNLDSHHLHMDLCSYVAFDARKRDIISNRKVGTLLKTISNRRRNNNNSRRSSSSSSSRSSSSSGGGGGGSSSGSSSRSSTGFVRLKVLDLEGIYKPKIPENLRNQLQDLRYLCLRWTSLDSWPTSFFGDLPSLETLDIKFTNITTLPKSIWKAKNLRHLIMNEVSIHKPPQPSSSKPSSVTKLETLTGLFIGSKNPKEYSLDSFTSLRKLGLTCYSKYVKEIAGCISRLPNVQTLKLRSRDRFGQPSDLWLSPMKKLKSLSNMYLFGVIQDGIEKNLPQSLTILTLSMSGLVKDPMLVLGQLNQLKTLRLLARSYLGQRMNTHGGFPKLCVLKLWKLEELKEWKVDKSTMPQLVELEIRGCEKMETAEGLEDLQALKELVLTNMPQKFVEKVSDRLGNTNILLINAWKSSSSKLTYDDDAEA